MRSLSFFLFILFDYCNHCHGDFGEFEFVGVFSFVIGFTYISALQMCVHQTHQITSRLIDACHRHSHLNHKAIDNAEVKLAVAEIEIFAFKPS